MAVVPEFRGVLAGAEAVDSLVVNPHKWLFTPMDCSVLYTRRPDVVRRTFSLVSPYLMTPEDDRARNLMDYGPAMGRRFRALKLWMVIRAYGTEGIAARIREHVALARRFAGWVDESPDWERLAPVPMSVVLFRHRPPGQRVSEAAFDAHNRRLLDAVNAGGRVFLSHTEVKGRYALRVAIGNIRTAERHLETAWQALREEAARLPVSRE
jgi:aromatic-L-amino-acid decarboxylase